jgi:hypothetical protein
MEMGGDNDDASSTSTLVEGNHKDKEKKVRRAYGTFAQMNFG